jgi:hypothetical protein
VPHVVQYSGVVPQNQGSPVSLRFSLYSAATGGEPVWSEQQSITPDAKGRYAVLLGAATPGGLPQLVFSNGAARWLGISIDNGEEQARTVLVATPYSLKASDAETIGGHPVSDFKLVAKDANGKPDTATDISQLTDTGGITFTNSGTGPTVGVGLDLTYLSQQAALCCALLTANNTFTGNQTIKGNLTVTGTGVVTNILAGGAVDITKSGSVYTIALDAAQGQAFGNTYWAQLATANLFKGTQTLAPLGTATSSTAYNSNALQMTGSAYNSSASAAEAINFVWQAEPTGNDSASPSGTMNLLYSTGSNAPAETGLKIGAAGKITFASGQTFPGTGTGTITGITTSSPLSGSGTSGSVALSLNTASLETTLNGVYPQLSAADTYTGAQTINSTETVSGTVASGDAIGSLAGQVTVNDTSTNASNVPVAVVANTAIGLGVEGIGAIGLYGYAPPSTQYVSYGVEGTGTDLGGLFSAPDGGTASGAVNGTGVEAIGYNGGTFMADTAAGTGVTASGYYGINSTGTEVGVEANTGALSAIGTDYANFGYTLGIFGDNDAGTDGGFGGLITSQDTWGLVTANNSPTGYPPLEVENNDTTGNGIAFQAYNAINNTSCRIDENANLKCSGTASIVHKVGDRSVETYSVQSSENWIEDFGSGQLSSGSAHIALEPDFAATVNTGTEYHVFLTPRGDSEGLYVVSTGPDGFDVKESRGGTSSIGFDYRIVAKRKGMENLRMADVTAVEQRIKAQHEAMHARGQQGKAPRPAVQPVRPRPGTLTKRAALALPKQ